MRLSFFPLRTLSPYAGITQFRFKGFALSPRSEDAEGTPDRTNTFYYNQERLSIPGWLFRQKWGDLLGS